MLGRLTQPLRAVRSDPHDRGKDEPRLARLFGLIALSLVRAYNSGVVVP